MAITNKHLTVSYYNTALPAVLQDISNKTGYSFAYSPQCIDSITIKEYSRNFISTFQILSELLSIHNLEFLYLNDQIIIRQLTKVKSFQLKGKILSANDSLPISYAILSLQNNSSATITDFKGVFDWEMSKTHSNDTIKISAMGYNKIYRTVNEINNHNGSALFLEILPINLPDIEIRRSGFAKVQMGNNGKKPSGSIYIDTHGQQTALFMDNTEHKKGKIVSVSFYISDEGNYTAPLRLHVYTVDSITGLPGADMIRGIFVIQPTKNKAWFEVDVREWNLALPKNGVFIAVEGIFPNDYSYSLGDEGFQEIGRVSAIKKRDEAIEKSIYYGQQIGYNRRMAESTWHYSLTREWFQLNQQNFGIMLRASVLIEKSDYKNQKIKRK